MKPILPHEGSQERLVLDVLRRGSKMTMLIALRSLGVAALSQRCTRLRSKYHWPIQSKMIPVSKHKRVALYWLERGK